MIKLPETAQGEIDRKALPAPDEIIKGRAPSPPVPKTVIEKRIAQLWQQLLKINEVSCQDNFFDLGGHSLLALAFIQAIEDLTQQHISLQNLSQMNLAEIAEQITPPNTDAPTEAHQQPSAGGRSVFKRAKRR